MFAVIGKFLLDWLLAKALAFGQELYRVIMRRKQVEEDSAKSVEKLKEAKDEKAIDDATRDTLGGL